MKKKNIDDEIDLIDLLILIWNKKFIILVFTFIPIIFSHIYNITQNKKELQIYSITSEILPISTTDENKYRSFTTFLKNYRPLYAPLEFEPKSREDQVSKEFLARYNIEGYQNFEFKIFNNYYLDNNGWGVLNLDKKKLFDYFIEILSQKSKLTKYLKEFGYINKNDYLNITEFESSLYKMALSIKILNNMENKLDTNADLLSSFFIEFQTDDLQKWEDFLKFLEKKINLEIQKNINQAFESHIAFMEKINKYYLEDVNLLKSSNLISEKDYLKAEQNIVNSVNYIKRIKNEYDKIPISSSEGFFAGKISYELVKFNYKKISKDNKNIMISLSGIIGLIIGLFVIFLSHAIKNRR